MKNLTEKCENQFLTETYANILFLMKTKNRHILTFSEKMQISAILYYTTNVKNMHLHRDSNPGPWNTVPML